MPYLKFTYLFFVVSNRYKSLTSCLINGVGYNIFNILDGLNKKARKIEENSHASYFKRKPPNCDLMAITHKEF